MTNDDLIQFAAEKLSVAIWTDPDYSDDWLHIGTHDVFDPLTRWEWLGKGIALLDDDNLRYALMYSQVAIWPKSEPNDETVENIGCPLYTPRAFWTAWYRLEKGD